MAAGLPVRMLQAMTIERRCLIPIVTPLATSPIGREMRHPCERLRFFTNTPAGSDADVGFC